MIDFLLEEIKAVYYIGVGLVIMFVGCGISDLFTGAYDKLWEKDKGKGNG